MEFKLLKKKYSIIIFFFLLNLTTLFAQDDKSISLDQQFCMLADNGSFNGRLFSITYASEGKELFFFFDSKDAVIVHSKMILPKVLNINRAYVKNYTLSWDEVEALERHNVSNYGIYLLELKSSGDYQAMIISETEVLLASYKNTSDSSKPEVEPIAAHQNPISIVQGQGSTTYGWVLGKNNEFLLQFLSN